MRLGGISHRHGDEGFKLSHVYKTGTIKIGSILEAIDLMAFEEEANCDVVWLCMKFEHVK